MEMDGIGAIVMLLRNVNHKGGLCKETCLLITRLSDHVIEVKILTGTHAGNISYLPRIHLQRGFLKKLLLL